MKEYNKLKSANVQLWLKDMVKSKARYFGGFAPDPQNQVTNYAKQAIKAGVDVIFPVGGPQAFTVIRTMKSENVNPNKMKIMGVDQDLTSKSFAGLPKGGNWTNYILASATKSISTSISSLSSSIFNKPINGKTPGTDTNNKVKKQVFGNIYTGTLANNWMSLTGSRQKGKLQTIEELYKSLGILSNLNLLKKNAADPKIVTSSTPFYGGK